MKSICFVLFCLVLGLTRRAKCRQTSSRIRHSAVPVASLVAAESHRWQATAITSCRSTRRQRPTRRTPTTIPICHSHHHHHHHHRRRSSHHQQQQQQQQQAQQRPARRRRLWPILRSARSPSKRCARRRGGDARKSPAR